MKYLGKYSPNGDIELPIVAEETGTYFFIQIGKKSAEVRKLSLKVQAGEQIVIPNLFQENELISFKIKKRNRRLVYHQDANFFSILIDRDDREDRNDKTSSPSLGSSLIEIKNNNTLILTANNGQRFEVTFDAEIGLFGSIKLG
jgi:hypothetical protein